MATKDVLAAVLPVDAVSSVYARKANILNAAIQEIGMGRSVIFRSPQFTAAIDRAVSIHREWSF